MTIVREVRHFDVRMGITKRSRDIEVHGGDKKLACVAWPLSDSQHRKDCFTSSTGDSEVVGTVACTSG